MRSKHARCVQFRPRTGISIRWRDTGHRKDRLSVVTATSLLTLHSSATPIAPIGSRTASPGAKATRRTATQHALWQASHPLTHSGSGLFFARSAVSINFCDRIVAPRGSRRACCSASGRESAEDLLLLGYFVQTGGKPLVLDHSNSAISLWQRFYTVAVFTED